jgi:hypothetical protein
MWHAHDQCDNTQRDTQWIDAHTCTQRYHDSCRDVRMVSINVSSSSFSESVSWNINIFLNIRPNRAAKSASPHLYTRRVVGVNTELNWTHRSKYLCVWNMRLSWMCSCATGWVLSKMLVIGTHTHPEWATCSPRLPSAPIHYTCANTCFYCFTIAVQHYQL